MSAAAAASSAAEGLVALPHLCLPRTLPLDHVRALILAGLLAPPPALLEDGTELVPLDYLDQLDPAGEPLPRPLAGDPEWHQHVERGVAHFADGARRLPGRPPERRFAQLQRMGGAAWKAGLGLLMCGHQQAAGEWLDRSALCYRRSLEGAESGSWGRSIAALKARLIAADWRGAEREARWTLELDAAASASPIARYAASLAALTLAEDDRAAALAESLHGEEAFPDGTEATAFALAALAARSASGYGEAVGEVLGSFETRSRFLEKVPVADTVIVLQRLAARRGIARPLGSPRLPESLAPW